MKNLALKVETKKNDNPNEVEIKVEAPIEISNKAYTIAFRDISNELNIPGFRKGKIPKDIVEKTVGASYISQKAFEKIFFELILNASKQENLNVLDVIKVLSFDLSPEKPLIFTAVLELKPEIKISNYKNKKVNAKKIKFDKEDFLQKSIDRILNNFITFEPVTDRSLVEGDLVTVDFEGRFTDGSSFPEGKIEGHKAVFERGNFLPEFIEKLSGAPIGETREVELTFPDTAPEAFAGKSAIFSITVKSIEGKVKPDLTDELTKKFGIESVEKLNEKILQEMEQLQENNSKADFENNLIEEILKESAFELSNNMISREVDHVLSEAKSECEKRGKSWDAFKKDESNKSLIEEASEVAKKRISIDLVLSEIVQCENISVEESDINEEINRRISILGEKYAYLKNNTTYKNTVEQNLLRNKAINFLVDNNEAIWTEHLEVL